MRWIDIFHIIKPIGLLLLGIKAENIDLASRQISL